MYAQYFALVEMGFQVNEIVIYSMDDNKKYSVDLPENNIEMLNKFECLIREIQNFNMDTFVQTNPLKCSTCVYEELCSFSLKE